jgi:hypothetical protein
MITTIHLLFVAAMLAPLPFFWFLHRKGWMTPARSQLFIFTVVSFVAIGLIAEAIAKVHGRFQPFGLIVCIVGMWLAALLSRRNNPQPFNPCLGAVLIGYIAVMMLTQNS